MDFEDLNNYLDLEPEQEAKDRLIFDSTVLFLKNYLKKDLRRHIPADLKECIIKLFLFKRQELLCQMNGENVELVLPENIRMVLDFHKRKTL